MFTDAKLKQLLLDLAQPADVSEEETKRIEKMINDECAQANARVLADFKALHPYTKPDGRALAEFIRSKAQEESTASTTTNTFNRVLAAANKRAARKSRTSRSGAEKHPKQ